ncbi:MAG TPA: radical SAM protein [Anaerolineales bacterium]
MWAEVDEQGRLILPTEVTESYGVKPGTRVRIEKSANHLRLHRPVSHLTKIYVEPTDLCNLNCTICIRNGWDEPLGRMSQSTFNRILAGLKDLSPKPSIFFGGLGEPLFHPKTIEWVAAAKAAGVSVELITNGTTLTEKRSRQLIEAGLDVLWVSIDGATPESYSDVRLGAQLPKVLANLARFSQFRRGGHFPTPEIGIAFVAMRRNIKELPDVLKIGRQLGARRFSVSNVMPYTSEMQDERLYVRTLRGIAYMASAWLPKLSLPKMDIDEQTQDAFFQALNSGCNVNFAGNSLSGANDVCNFIESGTMSISWNGGVSPCWPLMHNHVSYLHGKERRSRRHVIGNVNDRSLESLWLDPGYIEYREKVQGFEFAPCTFCGGCDLSEANEEDCLGNEFPACGGCLWSQGVIQCP